MIIANG